MNELIIGRRGTGKSTLARSEAAKLNTHQIFFDPGDQFENVECKIATVKQLHEQLEKDWSADGDGPVSISYVPASSAVQAEWDAFARELWDFTGTHEEAASYALVIDETHELQGSQWIDDWLARFIRRSPRRERGDPNPVDLIQTTHNPQDLNRLTFSQQDEIFIFNMFDRRALKAIADQWGEEVAEAVKQLRTPKTGGRDVLQVEAETGEYKVLTNSEEWYTDIRVRKEPKDLSEQSHRHLEELWPTLTQ
jgi:hypothetical protein